MCHLHVASMLSIRTASMRFTCCFEASNHPIFYIPSQYAIYTYCQYAIYMLLRSFEPPNLTFPASMLSIRIASMRFTCCFEASNNPIFYIPSQYAIYTYCQYAIYMLLRTTQSYIPGQYAIYTYCQYAIYMLLRSFEPPSLTFPASILSIRIASMLFTCCFEASNHPILHSRPVCYLYVLPVCHLHAASKLRTTQSYIPGQYALYTYCQYAIYMLLRSFEPPNLLYSQPVCYLYVLPVCHLHAASKLRTTQSYIPGQYAIYTYCQCAIYMLLRSFEPPNHLFPVSMLSIRTASMRFTCCFEASNHPIFYIPSQYAIYTYCQYAIYMLLRSFELPNLTFPASILSIRIASMRFTCCFEASNHPIFYIPSQYAIYTYCQYAIYMLLRSFEPPNLTFPASMLSIRIASVPFTCCFEASNHPIIYSQSVCYLYALPVCDVHAASKLRTTQSSIFPASMLSIRTASMRFTCCFELPNLTFPASMLSIRIASMPFTCCFEASNHPILHSRLVFYLYVLPVCYLHAASKLRTAQSYIPGQYAIYTYCQCAIYMLLRSFEPPNHLFPVSMLSIRTASMRFTCCFEASNHPIFYIPSQYAIYTYCQYAIYMLLRSFEPPNLTFPASMLSIRTASMRFTCCFELPNLTFPASMLSIRIASVPFTCCFEASNHPIIYSQSVCYLYALPVCDVHAASKLRTTQSSIFPASMLSIRTASMRFTCCFELPNLTFPASMLSIRIASVPFTCCFEASNHPIIYSQSVCYLYALPVCDLHAASKLRITQSSIFPASMLSIRIASMPFTCCFEASNYPILHSRPVCYLYALPVCDLHAASKLRITQSSIFPASMLSIRIASMPFTCCFEASNHPILHSRPVCYLYVPPVCDLHAASNYPILHSRPVCYLYVLPVCHLHAASKLRTTQSYIPG